MKIFRWIKNNTGFLAFFFFSMFVIFGIDSLSKTLEVLKQQETLKTLKQTNDTQIYIIQIQQDHIDDLWRNLDSRWVRKITVTAYTTREEECGSDPEHTAIMTTPVPGWHCAVSEKLWNEGWTFGHQVYIKGYGVFLIQDKLNKTYDDEYRIDLLVGTVEEAEKIGVNYKISSCLIIQEF